MSGFPILSLMLLVPLLAALACLKAPAPAARTIALAATLGYFAVLLGGSGLALHEVMQRFTD